MKKINKILIWFLAGVLIIFIISSIAVSLFAKKIVVGQIRQNLKMEASLDSIGLKFPFFISLNNLKIGDLFAAKNISFYPNVFGFLAGKIVIGGLTVIEPVINLVQSSDGHLNLPKLEPKGKHPSLFITGLRIKDGRFIFIDRKVIPEGYKIVLDKINIHISKVMLPVISLSARFKCSAQVVDLNSKRLGDMDFSGWVDFIKKDMDAVFRIADLDAVYFYPYYGNFISNKKILSARLDFKSHLKAENNDLAAVSNLRLSNLVYAKEEDETGQKKVSSFDFSKNTLDLFTDREGNLNLDFTIRTKLDNPKLRITDLKGVVLSAAAKNLSQQNPADVIEKVSDTVEQFKDIGKELKGLFKK